MPSSVRIEIPYFTVENAPQMTDAEHEAILERNRERYSASPPETPPEPIVTFTPRPPEMEPSKLDSADKNDDENKNPQKNYNSKITVLYLLRTYCSTIHHSYRCKSPVV